MYPTNIFRQALAGVLLLTVVIVSGCVRHKEGVNPPVAEKIARVDTVHGQERIDNYFWLRDKSDSGVIAYLEAENAYTETMMKHTEEFQEQIYRELIGRIKETDLSVPYKVDGYFYYSRTEEGKDYRIYCRKQGSLEAVEEILLDMNQLAAGKGYCGLGIYEVSPDHNLLAYAIDTTGGERFILYLKDLRSGEALPDQITNVAWSLEWANDNKTFFYTTRGEANRPDCVWRHILGTDPEDDKLIFLEEDDRFFVGITKTKDKTYLLVEMGSNTTTEVHYLDANNPAGKFKVVAPRVQEVEYSISHHSDKFYIVTNENAINFKLMAVVESDPDKENWRDVISHRENVKLDNIEVFRDFLAVIEREEGLRQLQIRNLKTGENHYVEWREPVYSFWLGSNYDFDLNKIRFRYTSLTSPRAVYDYDMNTKERELLKEYEVLGGYDRTQYQSQRIFATAGDGTKVPISLVYRKGMRQDNGNPLYLYAYGAYGASMDPYFSSNRVSLLDRGFIFALAHVRGGGEMGRPWYDNGKMRNKMNTFTDLIACAEHLINVAYTSSDQLIVSGASAGGLTVGAVANMRPDLFRLVVADVPFVDVVNTMLDETIPLTVVEYEEWGNPHIREYYDYMMRYSPYDNVAARAYPTMLITASLNDPRVGYWEPAKWCARLRAYKTDNNTLLLKTNMGAGHIGASGRYERYREVAFEYTFILDQFGISE